MLYRLTVAFTGILLVVIVAVIAGLDVSFLARIGRKPVKVNSVTINGKQLVARPSPFGDRVPHASPIKINGDSCYRIGRRDCSYVYVSADSIGVVVAYDAAYSGVLFPADPPPEVGKPYNPRGDDQIMNDPRGPGDF